MLSGFNTNVRHKGVLFHVQTEDSGRDHPHVITHLFHGGNVLASEKQGYAHLLEDEEELEPQVKRLMDEQHSAMLERLRSGAHDRAIRERLGSGSSPSSDATDPPMPPPDAAPRASKPAARVAPKTKPVEADPASPDGSPERQRPLDEVVLDYLLDSARQRTRR